MAKKRNKRQAKQRADRHLSGPVTVTRFPVGKVETRNEALKKTALARSDERRVFRMIKEMAQNG